MVAPTLSPPSTSERSEKNTSCRTLSAARSSRIMSIIIAMALLRTGASHSDSGLPLSLSPYSCASVSPTGLR